MSKIKQFFADVVASVKMFFATAQWFNILKIALCSVIALLLIFFGAAKLFKEEGVFTVTLDNSGKNGEALVSLSETADFANPTVRLSAGGTEKMTNISGYWIPDTVADVDGSHNGDNYIAYTFYAKNAGESSCNMVEEFRIDAKVKGADEAMRVRMYKNGELSTYAKMGKDGVPEYGTTPFVDDTLVFTNTNENFGAGEIIKYTLVIWLEGDDPECLDNIKGGNVRMSMTFSTESPPIT